MYISKVRFLIVTVKFSFLFVLYTVNHQLLLKGDRLISFMGHVSTN